MPRIAGIETEYGCLVQDGSITPSAAAHRVRDYIFRVQRLGVLDRYGRSDFEPAGCGGFLVNGARLYVDAVGDHEEYCTPECSTLAELVAAERAGQRILQAALDELGWTGRVSFHTNSIDHFGGHTFGCHENYHMPRRARQGLSALTSFLATRQIFAGAGRVGGHRIHGDFSRNERRRSGFWIDGDNGYAVSIDRTVRYQLSQRADHILYDECWHVRDTRAMLNPRGWDDMDGADRLHLLFGEGNMMETALALKVGTTKLVLDLIEEGTAPELPLDDAAETLRKVSRDETWTWLVRRADGRTMRAVDLQRAYLEAAQRRFAGRDPDTDWTLHTWEEVLDGLERDPMELADRLDWVAKLRLLYDYMDDTGVGWGDDALVSLDLVYHDVNQETGLYYGLEQAGLTRRIVDEETIRRAMRCPPSTTRAYARGKLVERALTLGGRTAFGWEFIYLNGTRLLLRDPADPYPLAAGRLLDGVDEWPRQRSGG